MDEKKKIDQKAYLQKYLSGDKAKSKKKSKKHKKKLIVIDDDINHVDTGLPVDEEELLQGEDAPQIVAEFIEERPIGDDKKNVNKWHCISDNKTFREEEVLKKEQTRELSKSSDFSPIRSNERKNAGKLFETRRHISSNHRSHFSEETENKEISTQKQPTKQQLTPEQLQLIQQNYKLHKNYDSDQSPSRKITKDLKKIETESLKNRRFSKESYNNYKKSDYSEFKKRKNSRNILSEKERSTGESSDLSPRRTNKTKIIKSNKEHGNHLPVQIKDEDSDLSPSRRRIISNSKKKDENKISSEVFLKQEYISSSRRHNKSTRSPTYIKREHSDLSSLERSRRSISPKTYRKEKSSPIRIKKENFDMSPVRRRKDSKSPRRHRKDQSSLSYIKREYSKSPKRRRRDKSPPIHIKQENDSFSLKEKSIYKELKDERGRKINSERSPSKNKKSSKRNLSRSDHCRSLSTSNIDSDQSVSRKKTYRKHVHKDSSSRRKNYEKYSSDSNYSTKCKIKESHHKTIDKEKKYDNITINRENNSKKTEHSPSRRIYQECHLTKDTSKKKETHLHRERSASSDYEKIRNDDKLKKRKQYLSDKKHLSSNTPEHEYKNTRRIAVDSKKAGLQNANDLKAEMAARRDGENRLIEELPSDITGRDAEVQVRRNNRYRKNRDDEDPEKVKLRKERELAIKEQYERWGKGLKQLEDHRALRENEAYEGSKPLARYANDKDLEKYLREQERPDDPMLEYMRQRRKEKEADEEKKSGVPYKPKRPTYKGPYPENRFGIPPGYRWDGVDRSNGFEERWFKTQSENKARQEEAYKYSVEDM